MHLITYTFVHKIWYPKLQIEYLPQFNYDMQAAILDMMNKYHKQKLKHLKTYTLLKTTTFTKISYHTHVKR